MRRTTGGNCASGRCRRARRYHPTSGIQRFSRHWICCAFGSARFATAITDGRYPPDSRHSSGTSATAQLCHFQPSHGLAPEKQKPYRRWTGRADRIKGAWIIGILRVWPRRTPSRRDGSPWPRFAVSWDAQSPMQFRAVTRCYRDKHHSVTEPAYPSDIGSTFKGGSDDRQITQDETSRDCDGNSHQTGTASRRSVDELGRRIPSVLRIHLCRLDPVALTTAPTITGLHSVT